MTAHLCGACWSIIETEAARTKLESAGIQTSAESLVGFRANETVLLWDAEHELFGKLLPSWLQRIGTCVGMAMGRATQDAILWTLAFGGQVGATVEVAWEPTYAVARQAHDIGAGKMGADPSGNYPSWYARALHRYGVATRRDYGAVDLTQQREDLAANWATGKRQPPAEIVSENRQWLVAACRWPESVEEVLGCLRAGYGVSRAANVATRPKRQANGYCGLQSSGGHAECWRGVIVDQSGNVFVAEQQSWPGEAAPHGPHRIVANDGRELELPEGCGLLDMDDVQHILKTGEVIAIAPPRNLWRET